jgi:transcriptional regulator with XRE-family HTH domain/tetratricopeptide (TPR) repeat protein
MDEKHTFSFGYWLRRRRKALDLTQERLADAVSCSRFTIRKIEAEERRPSRGLAERLARTLAVAPAEREAFLAAALAARPAQMAVDRQPVDGPDADAGAAPPFVGRRRELDLMRGLMARLPAGAGHVALIEGEPGIGKSRLLHEAAAHGRARGLCALATRCYEIERAMPYQPVIDLAQQAVVGATPAALRALPPVLLAEIAALVPALVERVAVPALSSDLPEARQARLFRAIVQLLGALAAGRALLMLVDDLQWADDASAQFFHFLAREAAQRPMLALYAMRDEDVGSDERLGALASSLRREAHVRHVVLARFDLADSQALLQELEPVLVERLHRDTEGNPFFLTSVAQALREGQAAHGDAGDLPLPDALRASVRARLTRVPAAARPTLDGAAVLGRHFEFDTLVELTGEPEPVVLQALDLLVARRLLREDAAGGTYDFAHDKVREVAYLEIGAGRRLVLHRALAQALERAGEDGARPAEHYERGHVWPQALYHMVRAARRSQKLFAMRDALRWFDRAVALAEARPAALQAPAPTDLIDLIDERGAARAQAGLTAGAVGDFGRVIDAARMRADRSRVRDTLIKLGMAHRRADAYEPAVAALTEALHECREMNDERRAADTLYHLGTVAWSDGSNGEAIQCHAEAVAICDRLGLVDLVAVQAWHGRGEAHFSDLEPSAAIACYERSIELARGIGDRSYEAENLMMVGYACIGDMGLGDYPKAEARFHAALDMSLQADLQWHIGPCRTGLDHVHACTGRYGLAWTGLKATLQWLQQARHTRYQLMAHDFMADLLLELGLHAEAADMWEQAGALARSENLRYWRPRIDAGLAIARMRLGRRDVGPLLEGAAREARAQRERMQVARCLPGLAEYALQRGEPGAALEAADELLAAARAGALREFEAIARRWRAMALARQGHAAAATDEFMACAQAAEALGRVRLAYDAAVGLAGLGAGDARAARLADCIAASVQGSGLQARLPG